MFLHIGWHDTNITDDSNWSKNDNSVYEQSSVPIEISLKTRSPTDICGKWKGVQRNIFEIWEIFVIDGNYQANMPFMAIPAQTAIFP